MTDGQKGGWEHEWGSEQTDVGTVQGAGEFGNVTERLRVERQRDWIGD